jgi:hypothetical protein
VLEKKVLEKKVMRERAMDLLVKESLLLKGMG